MALRAWVALGSDDYAAALNFAETSISIALTPYDRELAKTGKIAALVLLRRQEAFRMLRDYMDQCTVNGWHLALTGYDGIWGVALVVHGEIGEGIRSMKQAILRREPKVDRRNADLVPHALVRNLSRNYRRNREAAGKGSCAKHTDIGDGHVHGEKRIRALLEQARRTPELDPDGHHIGRSEMILGLLCKAKKKRALAVQHLTEAKRIILQFGQTPILARVETALAELGQ